MERQHTASAPRAQEANSVLASLAVISRASKHLHDDLAKAIEALEQKKGLEGQSSPTTRHATALHSGPCAG